MVIQQLPNGSDISTTGIADNRLVYVVAVVVGRVGNVVAKVVFGDVFRTKSSFCKHDVFHTERKDRGRRR